MCNANMSFVALLVGASIAAFALPALAQVTPERRAAIHRCIAEAQRLYPGPSAAQDTNRSDYYMACMTSAGFDP